MLRRLSAARATPFVVFCSATFFCARKNAAHFFLSGAKKRRQPITLGNMAQNFVENILKNLDKTKRV
jgi:hypothetical protein